MDDERCTDLEDRFFRSARWLSLGVPQYLESLLARLGMDRIASPVLLDMDALL